MDTNRFVRATLNAIEILDLDQQSVLQTHPGQWIGWFGDQQFVVQDNQQVKLYRIGQQEALASIALDPEQSVETTLLPADQQILVHTPHQIKIYDLSKPAAIQEQTLVEIAADQGYIKIFPQRAVETVLWAQNPRNKAQSAQLFRYLPDSKKSELLESESNSPAAIEIDYKTRSWQYGPAGSLERYMNLEAITP